MKKEMKPKKPKKVMKKESVKEKDKMSHVSEKRIKEYGKKKK